MQTFKCYILREPIGVVGLITPWYLSKLPNTFCTLTAFKPLQDLWVICSFNCSQFATQKNLRALYREIIIFVLFVEAGVLEYSY